MTPANKNLLVRVASAGLLSPILIVVILWDQPEPMLLAVQAAVVVGLAEYTWIVLKGDPVWMRVLSIFLGTLLSSFLCIASAPGRFPITLPPELFVWLLVLCTLAVCIVHLLWFGELASAPARVGLTVLGFVYVPLLLTPLGLFKLLPDGTDWIFLTLTLTWFSDTGAYGVGRALGRHKLYPAISPGKSVEGALGGLGSSVLAAVLARAWYMPQLSLGDIVLIALPGGALGQLGDLVESMFKRAFGVKDSGWIIPGHGGLLDRIDALLFCIPYVYIYAKYIF